MAVSTPYRRWVPVVLLATAITNIAITPVFPEHAQPVKWHAESDLRYLVFSERESVGLRFGFYEDLRISLGGGTLMVPPDRMVNAHVARGLAGVTVIVQGYDPAVDAASLPAPTRSGTHDGFGDPGRYVILPGDADTAWLGRDGDLVLIVPTDVAPVPVAGDG